MKPMGFSLKQFAMTALLCLGVCGLILPGCGGKEDKPKDDKAGKAAPLPPVPVVKTPAGPPVTPGQPLTPTQSWAKNAMDCYEKAMKDTVAALEGEPAAEQVLPKLRAIKDKAVEGLIPLGRKRETMDASTRAQAEMAMWRLLEDFQKNETFQRYNKLVTGPYAASKATTDPQKEASDLAIGMNIITQYAHFEILKKQAPKEAERLGIR